MEQELEKEFIAQHFYQHGMRTTVVAVVNAGRDWAAYLGATLEVGFNEEGATQVVHQYGHKLSEEQANAFFPNVTEPYRK
jgi:hypothetical protein